MTKCRQTLVHTLETEQAHLTPLGQELFHTRYAECGRLAKEVADDQEKLEALAHTHPVCQRLQTVPAHVQGA